MGGWKFGRKCREGYKDQARDNRKGGRSTNKKPQYETVNKFSLYVFTVEIIKAIYSYCKKQIKLNVVKYRLENSESIGFVNVEVLEVREIK
jgi:hypothetical protein